MHGMQLLKYLSKFSSTSDHEDSTKRYHVTCVVSICITYSIICFRNNFINYMRKVPSLYRPIHKGKINDGLAQRTVGWLPLVAMKPLPTNRDAVVPSAFSLLLPSLVAQCCGEQRVSLKQHNESSVTLLDIPIPPPRETINHTASVSGYQKFLR